MTNVDLIKREGIRICRRIPRQVRKELNEAARAGILCHIPKTKLSAEIYCTPELKNKALEMQKSEIKRTAETLLKVFA